MSCFRTALLAIAVLLAAGSAEAYGGPTATPELSPAQLRADLAVIETALTDRHPDIDHSARPGPLARRLAEIRAELDRPMSRDEAWRILATLNPVLADAHMWVGFPDRRGEVARHVAAGGRLFPFEVEASPEGDLRIRAALGGGATPLAGSRIERINGRSAREVLSGMMARMQGESEGLRAGLLSSRWALLYWKVYGAPTDFQLVVRQNGIRRTLRVDGVAAIPQAQAEENQFAQQFSLELRPCGAAVLRIDTFAWPDEDEVLAFTRDAFAQIEAADVKTLVIDIRDNEGGNDSQWQRGLLPYLATQRYQWASSFRKRVLNPDPATGERAGDVVAGPVETWLEPDLNNPQRFEGETYVLVGRRTYSSAVLFANVVQHYGFATLAGTGGLQRSNQTGGTQTTALPNSGLVVGWPRFILTHPGGLEAPDFLEPDVKVPDDSLQPAVALEALINCRVAAGPGDAAR